MSVVRKKKHTREQRAQCEKTRFKSLLEYLVCCVILGKILDFFKPHHPRLENECDTCLRFVVRNKPIHVRYLALYHNLNKL